MYKVHKYFFYAERKHQRNFFEQPVFGRTITGLEVSLTEVHQELQDLRHNNNKIFNGVGVKVQHNMQISQNSIFVKKRPFLDKIMLKGARCSES